MSRNNPTHVKQLLKQGHSPILPFEKDLLRIELERLGVEQGALGRLLGEAMSQSSETWHDNAPADAVNHQSRILAGRAEQIIADLGSAVLLDYPFREDRAVTIGSIIGLVYPGESEADNMLLTGICRVTPTIREDSGLPNLDVITARSPLGEAILGIEEGGKALYRANGRSLEVRVDTVRQFDPGYLSQAVASI